MNDSSVDAAARALRDADFVLIGAGAGLSASAGLDYLDPQLFKASYPGFERTGLKTAWEGVHEHWSPEVSPPRRFWAFWATHIQRFRHDPPALPLYLELRRLVAERPHFVITTNVDGQFEKAGFEPFTPQGDYGKFQCTTPCAPVLYDNREAVARLLAGLDPDALEVREEDLPLCPRCGGPMERNLRIDSRFVEAPHMERHARYVEFLDRAAESRLAVLELGVGYQSPSIIRWPFDGLSKVVPGATLIRVNLTDARVPPRGIGIQADAGEVIRALYGRTSSTASPGTDV